MAHIQPVTQYLYNFQHNQLTKFNIKRALTLLLLVAVTVSAIYAGTPINQSELPKAALTFLSKYFSGDKIVKAEKDLEFGGAEYDVDLKSGAEVDFNKKGEWKDVKAAKSSAVPAGIIPSAIAK